MLLTTLVGNVESNTQKNIFSAKEIYGARTKKGFNI